ncbi:p27 [Bean yellow disorder virus]|uniref:p27 n=1 Tax=Bean yellow disorder virus TaxID=267970 RepID=B2BZX2_9CLOS|nr:p27 [Bean yellow disorder virus]ABY66971.1 p27 [Bean yellow disorder virus]
MEVDYPIQEFELTTDSGKSMGELIAKNFHTIVNVIQSHQMFDIMNLEHVANLCYTLHVMIDNHEGYVNLYAENNPRVDSFRDAGVKPEVLVNKKDKYFPTLTTWQLRDTLSQLEPVLNFVTELKGGLMNDFRVSNLFTVYKINNVKDLINSVHHFLNDMFKFGENVKAEFNMLIKDGKSVERMIKNFKKQKYLDENLRIKFKDFISENLVYEINFEFKNLGFYLKPIKNFN